MSKYQIHIDGSRFKDCSNRTVILRGINVASDAKFPSHPDQPSHISKDFIDGDDVSFVGRPFCLDDAHAHFARLRQWGFNILRYIFTWEAIEHKGPKKYDEEWIAHTISVLRLAKKYGFYVFMDPHQDVWSRFSGGSGAPLWTIYACGLDPRNFHVTQAALVQNTWPKPEEFPKMIWATNYQRTACQTMFTLFFAGRDFAPKCVIDGENIQDYLQGHYIDAVTHLAQRIKEAGDLEGEIIIGWESLNEPNRGLAGWEDITKLPAEQQLKKGTAPTVWQGLLGASGRSYEVDMWDFGSFGPYKSGKMTVDPKGTSAWLSDKTIEQRYGWTRGSEWAFGECIWAQHGVWDSKKGKVLRADYFHKDPETKAPMDYEYFNNKYFMQHWQRYKKAIRGVFPDIIMFCQPPVLELPPTIKGTEDDDPNMVFAPHYYDGITLMTKTWKWWNVDMFGILRGRYATPAFAIRVGASAIRNCLRDQLAAVRKEGMDNLGKRPCFFTEIGIPFDMDDKYAYQTGDYTSQVAAMDANSFALEGSGASGYTLWCYCASNTHYWGDQWNGEDLSLFSSDDQKLPLSSTSVANLRSKAASAPKNRPQLSVQDMSTQSLTHSATSSSAMTEIYSPQDTSFRAAEAFVRPFPIAVHGSVTTYVFDLKTCTFSLDIVADSATAQDVPTEVFLPAYHYPGSEGDEPSRVKVEVTGGKWEIVNEVINVSGEENLMKSAIRVNRDGEEEGDDDSDSKVVLQKLRWWHAAGEQKLTVKGVKRRNGKVLTQEEEEDICGGSQCTVM